MKRTILAVILSCGSAFAGGGGGGLNPASRDEPLSQFSTTTAEQFGTVVPTVGDGGVVRSENGVLLNPILQLLPSNTDFTSILKRDPISGVMGPAINHVDIETVLGTPEIGMVPKYNETGSAFWSFLLFSDLQGQVTDDQSGLTVAGIAPQRTVVANANYTMTGDDHLIAYTSLTTARKVTFVSAASLAPGRQLWIVDESGSASPTKTISIEPVGLDVANGVTGTQVVIDQPYGGVIIETNGAVSGGAWFVHKFSRPRVEFGLALSDETTAITTGTAKVTFRTPYAFTVTAVRANLNTVSSSGIPTVDIKEGGTTILSTLLTIDESEKTSTTAAVPAVISDNAIADDAEITMDITVAGTGAKGLKVWMIGYR